MAEVVWRVEQPIIVPVALNRAQRRELGITRREAYRLEKDYTYSWMGPDGCFRRITVPAGLIYDGASVPRLVWTISGITPDGLIRAAALIHDWLYIWKGLLPEGSYQKLGLDGHWHNVDAVWPREGADRIFARIMRECGVSQRRRRLAFKAVQWFGEGAWYS